MVVIMSGIKIPTPFGGSISTPPIETPPLTLPKMPDDHARKAIGHALGEDASQIVALIPWAGDVLSDILSDLHYAEIVKILTPDEYQKFVEYNKMFPSSVAMVRTLCFKEV